MAKNESVCIHPKVSFAGLKVFFLPPAFFLPEQKNIEHQIRIHPNKQEMSIVRSLWYVFKKFLQVLFVVLMMMMIMMMEGEFVLF